MKRNGLPQDLPSREAHRRRSAHGTTTQDCGQSSIVAALETVRVASASISMDEGR